MCGPMATWWCGFCLISIFWRVCWNTSAVRTSLASIFDNLHYSRWRETGSPCFISGHFISPSYVMLTDLGPDFRKKKTKTESVSSERLFVPAEEVGQTQTVALTRLRDTESWNLWGLLKLYFFDRYGLHTQVGIIWGPSSRPSHHYPCVSH